MWLDETHSLNQKLLNTMSRLKKLFGNPIASPDSHVDPYQSAGSHPDVVERIWDGLATKLPEDCRAIVYGRPALVHPKSGVVFVLAYGTQYAIRIPLELVAVAIESGCREKQHWTGGGETNIEIELGRGWLFGCWGEEESQWLLSEYRQLDIST